MAIQTYIKRQNSYTDSLTISGADADQVLGVYQTFVCLVHEWGTPVFNNSRLASRAVIGDTTISVNDGTQFTVGNRIVFLDGGVESTTISAIDSNILTVAALSKNHNAGGWISVEQVATRASANNYTYILTEENLVSSGQHKVKWHYIQSGISTFTDQFKNVYQSYIDSATFFEEYPELEDEYEDFFPNQERVVREIINTACGQSFDYYASKSLVFDGSGTNVLHTGIRIEDFIEIRLKDDNSDITELVEKDPKSDFYLRLTGSGFPTLPSSNTKSKNKPKWGTNSEFEVVANWGWSYVPDNITQAAGILIADQFNDDSKLPKHGVVEAYMDTHRVRFDSVVLGGTGNFDADTLLLDYTLFTIGQI